MTGQAGPGRCVEEGGEVLFFGFFFQGDLWVVGRAGIKSPSQAGATTGVKALGTA